MQDSYARAGFMRASDVGPATTAVASKQDAASRRNCASTRLVRHPDSSRYRNLQTRVKVTPARAGFVRATGPGPQVSCARAGFMRASAGSRASGRWTARMVTSSMGARRAIALGAWQSSGRYDEPGSRISRRVSPERGRLYPHGASNRRPSSSTMRQRRSPRAADAHAALRVSSGVSAHTVAGAQSRSVVGQSARVTHLAR